MKTEDFDRVIRTVERVEREFGSGRGREKRDAAVRLINAAVDIPWLPEWFEALLLGLLVDLVVHQFNRWWGHRWVDRLSVATATDGN